MLAGGDDSAGDGLPAREWETNWLDQTVAALNFSTPRQAAHGDVADTFRLEALTANPARSSALTTFAPGTAGMAADIRRR